VAVRRFTWLPAAAART